MRLLVTGANGFIGSALCRRLAREGEEVRAAVRTTAPAIEFGERRVVGEIDGQTDWGRLLDGVETVFHLAARAHVFGTASRAAAAFVKTNVEGTERLARAAASAGVRSFVFLSSAKVSGDRDPGRPFHEDDPAHPGDPYARSKWDAEQKLPEIAAGTMMRMTIVRPPLVYGPGVKANFLKLIRLVDRRVPLPLGSVQNARSFVYVENLCDALVAVQRRSGPAVQTFFVSDGEDVSTPELIRRIANSLGTRPRMFNFPPALLRMGGAVLRKTDAVERLTDSLRVDTARIASRLGWRPPHSMMEGLKATADWYRTSGIVR